MVDLVVYNIEGLCSLKTLHLAAINDKVDFSIKNLPSLIKLYFYNRCLIDENILSGLLGQVQHIQELCLDGGFSYFNLDNLVNLRVLKLSDDIEKNFNFELFKNLCQQLEDIKISFLTLVKIPWLNYLMAIILHI